MIEKYKLKLLKFMLTYKIKKSWIVTGFIIIILALGVLFGRPKPTEATEGHSTLPGWSAGYRYYFDIDDDKKSRLRLFSKYKYEGGNSFKIGWDKQTGKDLNQFDTNIEDSVIFFEQEFKF